MPFSRHVLISCAPHACTERCPPNSEGLSLLLNVTDAISYSDHSSDDSPNRLPFIAIKQFIDCDNDAQSSQGSPIIGDFSFQIATTTISNLSIPASVRNTTTLRKSAPLPFEEYWGKKWEIGVYGPGSDP